MKKIDCLISINFSKHLNQLYTGFAQLNRLGKINLTQNFTLSKKLNLSHGSAYLFCKVNNSIKLFYDTSDSYKINNGLLDFVDFYFKRSYDPIRFPQHSNKKIKPLGMNYDVRSNNFDLFEFNRLMYYKKYSYAFLTFFRYPIMKTINPFFEPTLEKLSSLPNYSQRPKILFMVRAWDPVNAMFTLNEKEKEERIQINNMRAQCIRFLRTEFGNSFYGGFNHTDFAKRNYKELLLNNVNLSQKNNYLNLLSNYPICIATKGLHGSIGWKMGEYVALSKSIVSEKMKFKIPGNFKKNQNYLEFQTPEECVENSLILFTNSEKRCNLMRNNFDYYNKYLKPDELVLRTLKIGLSETD